MSAMQLGGKEKFPETLQRITSSAKDPSSRIASDRIRVAIYDACPTIRRGLEYIFDATADIEVVTLASSMDELLSQPDDLHVDVVLFDIDDHQHDVVAYIEGFREKLPNAKIMVFTDCKDNLQIIDIIERGVEGFQCKQDADIDDLTGAIRTLHKGGKDLAPCVTEALLMHLKSDQLKEKSQLSPREQQVLDLIAKGKTNDAIGSVLSISTRTVKFHVSSILSKLHVKNRTEAALWLL